MAIAAKKFVARALCGLLKEYRACWGKKQPGKTIIRAAISFRPHWRGLFFRPSVRYLELLIFKTSLVFAPRVAIHPYPSLSALFFSSPATLFPSQTSDVFSRKICREKITFIFYHRPPPATFEISPGLLEKLPSRHFSGSFFSNQG